MKVVERIRRERFEQEIVVAAFVYSRMISDKKVLRALGCHDEEIEIAAGDIDLSPSFLPDKIGIRKSVKVALGFSSRLGYFEKLAEELREMGYRRVKICPCPKRGKSDRRRCRRLRLHLRRATRH